MNLAEGYMHIQANLMGQNKLIDPKVAPGKEGVLVLP